MKKNKKIFLILKCSLIFFSLLLFFLILLNFGAFSPKKEAIHIQINDECALILNTLITQIKDANICEMRCYNECEIREMNFYNSSFFLGKNSCNLCDCYCK